MLEILFGCISILDFLTICLQIDNDITQRPGRQGFVSSLKGAGGKVPSFHPPSISFCYHPFSFW